MDSNILKSAGIKRQFKNVSDILNIIPPEIIEQFAVSTGVDRHAKLLQGGIVFNTLLHMLLTESKLSQRVAYDTLKDTTQLIPVIKGTTRPVRDHSSICKRLQHIKVDFFEKIYETVRDYVTDVYDPVHLLKLHLAAVDSTIVAETCNKLEEGFHIGNRSRDGGSRKHVKYSEVFDGLSVLGVCFNDDRTRQVENNALPEVIRSAARQDRLHRNLYLIDRGLKGSGVMEELSGQNKGGEDRKVNFLVRVSDKRRVQVVETLRNDTGEYRTKDGRLVRIIEYDRVRIFSSASSVPDPAVYLHTKAEVFDIKTDPELAHPKVVNLLTDVADLSAVDMLEAYRYRWMIEVFFKFIKQNLDFSHLLSTSANGLKVMMYMTMIAAMMVLLYGKSNELGFRMAKFDFDLKLNNMIIAQYIIFTGGDPREFMNRYNLQLPKWCSTYLPPHREDLAKIVTDYDSIHKQIH